MRMRVMAFPYSIAGGSYRGKSGMQARSDLLAGDEDARCQCPEDRHAAGERIDGKGRARDQRLGEDALPERSRGVVAAAFEEAAVALLEQRAHMPERIQM